MKSKTVCFFRPSPILTNFTGLHQRMNGCYKHHTPLTTTHKFEKLHALQRKLVACMLLPAVRPIVALFRLKRSQFNLSPEAKCSST